MAVLLWCVTVSVTSQAMAAPADTPVCSERLTQRIPTRATDAEGAQAFAADAAQLDDNAREAVIEQAFFDGNLPDFLRRLQPVRIDDDARGISVTLCVMPDYLALGSDRDYLLTPMRLRTALQIADRYGFMLPTPKMVDAIYRQASVQLPPLPLPAGDQMRSTAYYLHHNALIAEQRAGLRASLGELTGGDKKDLVLTSRLWRLPSRVAIYGWHRSNGQPIQPLSTVHGERYADYSHGVRLISDIAYVNGAPQSLATLMQNPRYANLLSTEGSISRLNVLLATLGDLPTLPGLAAVAR